MSDVRLDLVHRFIPAPAPGEAPPGARRDLTLLLLHGTGGDENDLIPLGSLIAPGAAILSPRGKVLERGMPRFFRRLAEGVFDLEDLTARTHELADFLVGATAQYGFRLESLVAVGFSNGANIAGSTLLLRPGLIKAAVLLRPMVPFEPDPIPDLLGTSVFVGAGRLDTMVPPANAERLVEILREAGADVEFSWADAGHELDRDEVDRVRVWIGRLRVPTFG